MCGDKIVILTSVEVPLLGTFVWISILDKKKDQNKPSLFCFTVLY